MKQSTLSMKDREKLHRIPGVVMVYDGVKSTRGITTGEPSVVVGVKKKLPLNKLSRRERIPAVIQGMTTDVVEKGEVRAFQTPWRQGEVRPLIGGVSVGHPDVTCGTLGIVCKRGGEPVILSNNHVLANSNSAGIGDAILQPGAYDGGNYDKVVAELLDFKEILFNEPHVTTFTNLIEKLINFLRKLFGLKNMLRIELDQGGTSAVNYVDCAIAKILIDQYEVNKIAEIGEVSGIAEAPLQSLVRKFGRTTAYLDSSVEGVNGSVQVQFDEGRIGMFMNQIISGYMSEGGDSGSVVVNKDNKLVGLLFAGSQYSTIINPIQAVIDALGVEF